MAPATEARSSDVPVLELEREFDAPPSLLFDMWIDDEHIKRWLPIAGARMTSFHAQVRNGGRWRATLRNADGSEASLSGTYHEIVPHERLVFTHQFSGGPETLVVVRFADLGNGRTRMTLTQRGFGRQDIRDAHAVGWNESFETLARYAVEARAKAGQPTPADEKRVLEIDRLFDGPRELVFKLWTEPQHLVRWWGPRGWHVSHCRMDVRPGGIFRCCMSSEAQPEHWFGGRYREVRPPGRLSFTYANDADGHEMLVVIDFLDEAGKTRMKFRQSVFLSMNECEGHRRGWSETFDIFSRYVLLYLSGGLTESVLGWRMGEVDGVEADVDAAEVRAAQAREKARHGSAAQPPASL